MSQTDYDTIYFQKLTEGSVQSAKHIIPIIRQFISPLSVIDVGCGIGAWLAVWEKEGVKEILGIDGSYVTTDELLIKKEDFKVCDLANGFTVDKTFDLVTCLEVAEHIQHENAEILVNSICKSGNVILFSAAVPNQEGTHHVNEQYPDYWVSLFEKNNFIASDSLREKIWNNKNIQFWYRQNILFFIHNTVKEKYPEIAKGIKPVLSIIHPELFNYKQEKISDYEKALKNPFTVIIYFTKKYTKAFIALFKK